MENDRFLRHDFDKQTIGELREIHAEFWRFYEVVQQACNSGFRSKAANGVVADAIRWIEDCFIRTSL